MLTCFLVIGWASCAIGWFFSWRLNKQYKKKIEGLEFGIGLDKHMNGFFQKDSMEKTVYNALLRAELEELRKKK